MKLTLLIIGIILIIVGTIPPKKKKPQNDIEWYRKPPE